MAFGGEDDDGFAVALGGIDWVVLTVNLFETPSSDEIHINNCNKKIQGPKRI